MIYGAPESDLQLGSYLAIYSYKSNKFHLCNARSYFSCRKYPRPATALLREIHCSFEFVFALRCPEDVNKLKRNVQIGGFYRKNLVFIGKKLVFIGKKLVFARGLAFLRSN